VVAIFNPGTLSPAELSRWVYDALGFAGGQVISIPSPQPKPYRAVVLMPEEARTATLRIYAWNITHGGGSERAPDEFRIQLTGRMPVVTEGETTIVLGWSPLFNVFAAWDPQVHAGRHSASPSLQVRQETLVRAHEDGLAAALRESGDVVVAFRAELLTAYCLNADRIHLDPSDEVLAEMRDVVTHEPQSQVLISNRPLVERRLTLAYRAWDFRQRVTGAYEGQCAICGLGLGLIEAAHIVPVAWPESTDATSNGLALCRNHHYAYDSRLISVSSDCTLEISRQRLDALSRIGNYDVRWIEEVDGKPLSLPTHRADWPDPVYLELGRRLRRWVP